MARTVRASVLLLILSCSSSFAQLEPAQVQPAQAHTSEPNPQEQAWRILHDGLNDSRATKRAEAVKSLSLLPGDRRAATFALRSLRDSDARVRSAAATTLGQLHARNAIPALKQALSDKEVSVVLAASYSLFLFKDPSSYGVYYAILMGDKKASEGLVQAQLNRLKDPKQMAELGFQEGMGFVPFGGMGVEAYRAMTKKDSAPVRAAAARILALDPDPVSEDALLQSALADKNAIVRQAALDAIAQRGNPKCIDRLLKNLSDNNDAVRYRTAATILRLSSMSKKRSSTR
jgi:HEAT repeat protein